VEEALRRPVRPLPAQLKTRMEMLTLDLGEVPSEAELEKMSRSESGSHRRYAKRLIAQLKSGEALIRYVLVTSRDGDRVVYSLAELSPDLGSRRGIVAIEQDGQPLGEKDGPMRIVLEGEKRPARWIRQLERLRIVRVAK